MSKTSKLVIVFAIFSLLTHAPLSSFSLNVNPRDHVFLIANIINAIILARQIQKALRNTEQPLLDAIMSLQFPRKYIRPLVYGDELSKIPMLIKNGANVNAKDSLWKRTPLLWASSYNLDEIASLLIENGADVNVKTLGGWTPLMIASKNGNVKMLNLLIKNGADVASRNTYDKNEFFLAIPASWSRYIIHKFSRNTSEELGQLSAILVAAQHNHSIIVDLLLQAGATFDVNDEDTIQAFKKCSEEMVSVICKHPEYASLCTIAKQEQISDTKKKLRLVQRVVG